MYTQENLLCIHRRISCVYTREWLGACMRMLGACLWNSWVYGTAGCMYADVGRMSMERLGACMRMLGACLWNGWVHVCGCWVHGWEQVAFPSSQAGPGPGPWPLPPPHPPPCFPPKPGRNWRKPSRPGLAPAQAASAAGSWAGPGPGPDRLGLKCYLAWGEPGWSGGGKG